VSFYFPVVLTLITRTSLAKTKVNGGGLGTTITVEITEIMETMVTTIKTTVAGKGFYHRQAIITLVH